MPLGALIVLGLAILASASLSFWTLRHAIPNSWHRVPKVVVILFGAGFVYAASLYLSSVVLDIIYPFVPTEIPENTGALFGLLMALGDAGASLRTLEWAITTAYASSFAWIAVSVFHVWRAKNRVKQKVGS